MQKNVEKMTLEEKVEYYKKEKKTMALTAGIYLTNEFIWFSIAGMNFSLHQKPLYIVMPITAAVASGSAKDCYIYKTATTGAKLEQCKLELENSLKTSLVVRDEKTYTKKR